MYTCCLFILSQNFDDSLASPQSTQEDSTSDDENLLDFSVLFEMESLHKALLNIK